MSGSSRSSSSMACRRLDTNFCWLRSLRRQRGNAVNGAEGIGAPGLFVGLSSSSVIRSRRSLLKRQERDIHLTAQTVPCLEEKASRIRTSAVASYGL